MSQEIDWTWERAFGYMDIKTDKRINELTGYCPNCPIHEGTAPFVRLKDVVSE